VSWAGPQRIIRYGYGNAWCPAIAVDDEQPSLACGWRLSVSVPLCVLSAISDHLSITPAADILSRLLLRVRTENLDEPTMNQIMPQSAELVAARDEALRKVGRNVVNFQKVETCLRYLISVSDIQTTKDDLSAEHKRRIAKTKRLPFGHLSETFYQTIYGAELVAVEPNNSTHISISTSFRVEADAATVKRQKRTLSALVTERNRLIHRDLPGFDHNSISSCHDLIAMLDEQNVRVLSQLEELATLIAGFKAHMDALRKWAEADGPNTLVQRPSQDA
jgi:hypothetical protein